MAVAGLCWLPAAFVAFGASLALHVKLRTGEWTYRSATLGMIEGKFGYIPHPDAEQLDPHRLAAEIMALIIMLSVLLSLPLFLGFHRERKLSPRYIALHWLTLLALMVLFAIDPNGVLTYFIID